MQDGKTRVTGITVVNLERNPERRRFMADSLKNTGFPVFYFNAVDGAFADYDELAALGTNEFLDWLRDKGTEKELRSTIACAASHRILMEKLARTLSDDEWHIVFEDDVRLEPKFWEALPGIIAGASSCGFQMVLLGAHWPQSGTGTIHPTKVNAAGHVLASYPDAFVNGAFAYAVTKSGAARIASFQIPAIQVQADNWPRIWGEDTTSHIGVVVPQLVTTGYFETTMGYKSGRVRRLVRRILIRFPLFRRLINRHAPRSV